jgi:aspartyl aminopeptidase
MLSVVGYGGGLWHTWFDRDLTLAGRVLVRGADGKTKPRLVHIHAPILRIPNLAIHLQSDEERRGFSPNLQSHFPPVLASEVKAQLEMPAAAAASSTADDKTSPVAEHHHALLLRLLGEELGVDPGSIVDFELQLCDTQPSTVGGALKEFIYSGRLDNLASSYQALTALVDSCSGPGAAASLAEEPNVRLVALFDHEEIGSVSAQGAASSLMPEVLQRITAAACVGGASGDVHTRTLRRSFIVSADMAHALHPNYDSKHDPALQPKMHGGLVLKVRA